MARPKVRGILPSCILLLSAGTSLHAAPQPPFSVRIPAGPLSRSLAEIARLTGIEIALSDPALARVDAPPIVGRLAARALLEAATSGTGARFRFLTPTTVMVSGRTRTKPAEHRPESQFEALSSQNIIVTATKRQEYLNDLPMSTASLSQGMLDALGINDMRAIARVTPGVLVRNAWAGSSNLSIRGVYTNTGSATTGVYIDDTPVQTRSLGAGVASTNAYPALFDLQRVEVLRGPQGTLFGSGSEGGTIRFITREPDLRALSGSVAAEAFAPRGGAAGFEHSIALGGPIAEDRLGFRFSALVRRDGGWVDRALYPSGTITARNVNRVTSGGARGALTLKLGDVTIMPSVFYQHQAQRNMDQLWSLTSDVANGRYATGTRFGEPTEDKFLLSTLKVVVELPGVSFLSSTSYFRRRRPSTVDYTDYLVEQLSGGTRFTLPDLGDYQAKVKFDNNQDVLTQEFRLNGNLPFRWLAGLFLQRAQQDAVEYIHEALLNEALTAIVGQNALHYFGSDILPGGISYVGDDRSIDWQLGLFGQIDVPVNPTLQASFGLRLARMYYRQTNFQDGPQSGGQLGSVASHGEMPLLPRLGVAWRPRDGRLFYVNAAKGMRIGGANAQVSALRCGSGLAAFGLTQVPERYKSDTIWNYEAGAKLAVPQVHGSINLAAFHFDWMNIQQSFSLRCLFRFTGNNAHARGDGIELSGEIAPFSGFTASFAGSYTRARYTETTYGGFIDASTGERAIVIPKGQALPSPRWRVQAVARYERSIADASVAYVALSGDYASSYEQGSAPGAVDYDPALFISDAVTTVRVQIGARARGWDASLYADNLLDSRDALQKAHNARISINTRYVLVRPRTIGVRLSRSWQ